MTDAIEKPVVDQSAEALLAVETPTEVVEQAEVKTVTRRKKAKRSVPHGQLHIKATFNNTIVSFTDRTGAVLASSSAGACGFRGSKKGTAYAAQVAGEKAAAIAKQQFGVSKLMLILAVSVKDAIQLSGH